jgi:membrane protein required for colicin V production
MEPMNWVDAVMLGIVALSALAGFLRGFARELLGVAAWIIAAVLAGRLYGAALPLARRWIEDGLIADVVCFAVVFVLILIALSVLANLMSRLVRLSLLGGIDRILGFGFGLVRGAALLVLAYLVLAFVLPQANWPDPVRTAHGLPYLHAGARYALAQAPERWRPILPQAGLQAAPASGQESF